MAKEVGLFVPTRNGGVVFRRFLEALEQQTLRPGNLLVVDSSSEDGTPDLAQRYGFQVIRMSPEAFDHGGVRQFALEHMREADFLVFMTQDAVLASPDALEKLLGAFQDASVGAAYGRQVPRPGANPIEAHARLFNYPSVSEVRDFSAIAGRGLKAAFLSNSFAAYRRRALEAVGGFPRRIVMGEDAVVGAKLLLSGWKIAYQAEAWVYHSHAYTLAQELRRYFDVGAFHAQEAWLLQRIGKPEGEGLRYVRSEIAYLLRRNPLLIPEALLRSALRYAGYRLGRAEALLPPRFKPLLSLNPAYWRTPLTSAEKG